MPENGSNWTGKVVARIKDVPFGTAISNTAVLSPTGGLTTTVTVTNPVGVIDQRAIRASQKAGVPRTAH